MLAKDWKELHARAERHYASFAKDLSWNRLPRDKQNSCGNTLLKTVRLKILTAVITIVAVKAAKMTKLNLAPYPIAPCKMLSMLITMHSLQNLADILSLFARNFKGRRLKQLISGLTDFRIKEARKHCIEHDPRIAAPTPVIHRFFLREVERFLRFITSDMISQDTAYGTFQIKLESGEELLVPKPIQKMFPARIIAQYLKICDEMEFKPASLRTLLRILEVYPASTRKSLQGLDNYTTDGCEAFENLEDVIGKLYDAGLSNSEARRLRSMALSCKRYLKQDYSTHVLNDSTNDSPRFLQTIVDFSH